MEKKKKKKKRGLSHLGKRLNFFSPPLPKACPVGARQGRERGKGITKQDLTLISYSLGFYISPNY
jgi:hypothetical protein